MDGGNHASRIEARGELPGRSNDFLGNDPALWRTDVPSYAEVVYREIWPGVDVSFRYRNGALTYAATATDGGTAPAFSFLYEGADPVVRRGDAEAILETAARRLVEIRRSATEGAFLLGGPGQTKGAAQGGKNNPEALLWSTYMGGSSEDIGYAIALDASGNPVLTGSTYSPNFPATPGAYDISYSDDRDVFIAKFSSTGSELLYSTFLGGNSIEECNALVLDGSGKAVVAGRTYSANFPTTTGAYDTSHNGNYDALVARLSIGVAATSVADPDAAGVSVFLPSMPNPFRGRAVIRYNLARETDVDLGIYDVRGRLVKTLAAGRRSAGTHGEAWDGRDASGRRAATGTYLVRLQTGGQQFQKRITMLR